MQKNDEKKLNIKPLLSICIPTYNRDIYLKKSIESLIVSSDFLNKRIEIVVSDNLSTDNTQSICKAFEEKYDNFHYYRNEQNIYDENFPKVLSYAKGTYRKLSNDSHIYEKDAVRKICAIIEKYEFVKPYIYWAIAKWTTAKKTKMEEKVSFDDFLLIAGEHITNILSFGLWEDECDEILGDLSCCKLKLWQACATLKLASKNSNIIIYNEDLVKEQKVLNKEVSYDVFNIFHDNYLSIVSKYENDGKQIDKIEKRMLFDTFYHWRLKWDDEKTNIKFNKKNENLPLQIKNTYEKKPYYWLYVLKLNLAKTCRKIKRSFVK